MFLKHLLSLTKEKFESDNRSPFFVLDLSSSDRKAAFELYSFNPLFWLQSFLLLSFQALVNCAIAVVIYYGIIQKQQQQNNLISPYLIGYGIVIPFLICLPFWLIEWLDLYNVAFILCVGGSNPAMLVFRCLESMHQTMPSYLSPKLQDDDKGLKQFIAYYASSIQFELNETSGKPIPFHVQKHAPKKFLKFAGVFLQTTVLYSLLLSFDYRVFPSSSRSNAWADLFYWGNLLNNYLMAALTGLCLETGACGLGLMTSCLTGMATMDFSDAPLTKSTSPSDFWGKRWNKLVGPALRRGAYLPMRKCLKLHAHVASALTFVASGLLHEYVLFILSQRHGVPQNPFENQMVFVPSYGKHLFFFSWCAATLLAERFLGTYFDWLPRKGPIRTLLVLLTTLPVAHFFTDEYVACSFYNDISLGFPKILYVGEKGNH